MALALVKGAADQEEASCELLREESPGISITDGVLSTHTNRKREKSPHRHPKTTCTYAAPVSLWPR